MGDEDTLPEVDELKVKLEKQLKLIQENTNSVKKLTSTITTIGSQSGLLTGSGQRGSGNQLTELRKHSELLRQLLLKTNGQTGRWGEQQKLITGGGGGGNFMQYKMDTSKIGQQLQKTFKPLMGAFSKIGSAFKGVTSKIWSGLKRSGLLPGVFMGIGVAVGAVMAKVISSSPLLQAMLKMFSMGMTLIFRPIGDFIGSMLRPMMISFIKDVAVPLFQAAKPLVKQGEGIGKLLLGWVSDPIKAMMSATTLALAKYFPLLTGTSMPIVEAHAFQQNASAFARRGAGAGEFAKSKSFSIVPTDVELGLAGYSEEDIAGFKENSVFKTGYDWRKIAKVREDMEIPAPYEQQVDSMGNTRTMNERIFGEQISSSEIHDRLGIKKEWWMSGGSNTSIEEGGFWENMKKDWDNFWDSINPIQEAAADTGDGLETLNESLAGFDEAWNNWVDGLGKGWDNFIQGISQWGTDISIEFDKWVESLQREYKEWEQNATTWADGIWTTFLEFIGLGEKANEQQKETTEKTEEADKSWLDTLWDMVSSWTLGSLTIKQAFAETTSDIENAGEQITTAVETATGGMFTPGRPNPKDPSKGTGGGGLSTVKGGTSTSYNPSDPNTVLGGGYSAVAASGNLNYLTGKNVTHSSPVMSAEEARKRAIESTGGSPLGDYLGNRFEFSPGKFGDIYNKQGDKISPTSDEGKIIQGIYQKQHEKKIQNAAQQAHIGKIHAFTSATESQAYVMAGGGEAGLEAARLAKEKGLNLQTFQGLADFGDLTGVQHSMIDIGRKEVAAANTYSGSSGGYAGGSMSGSVGMSTANSGGWGISGGGTTSTAGTNASRSSSGGSRASGGSRSTGGSKGTSGGGAGGGSGASGSRGSRSGGRSGGSSSGGSSGGSSKGSAGGKSGSRGRGGKGSRGGGKGYGGIISEPIVGIGMQTGKEWFLGEHGNERVLPIEDDSGVGLGNIIINVGNITKEADYMKLKPLIQRWILEASSRRGTV